MKIIKKSNDSVAKIINIKKLKNDVQYRLSTFSYLYSNKEIYVIRNTLSFEVAELTQKEWDAVQLLKNNTAGCGFILENHLEQLVLSRFIVEEDYDEVKQYQKTVFLIRTISGIKKGLATYTIFPTTGCNARCIYCYEEEYKVKTMTSETADRLIDYICETRHNDKIRLQWFGGEPLCKADIISYICRGLQERGVLYESTMVTNASLMTKELAAEARELWHLKKVQVSLDGKKEDYDFRKNYYDPVKFNYDVVMNAVHCLADENIKVNLRVNVDFDNIAGIPAFFKALKNEFSDMRNITLYLAPLFQVRNDKKFLEFYGEILKLTDYQKSIGIPKNEKTEKRKHLKINYCMADSLDKSVVITPDGVFNNCEHLPENNSWGNIFDGITNRTKYDELCSSPKIDEKCAKCPFLPECTPFYKTGCAGWFDKCYEYHCMKTDYALDNLVKGEITEVEDDNEEI